MVFQCPVVSTLMLVYVSSVRHKNGVDHMSFHVEPIEVDAQNNFISLKIASKRPRCSSSALPSPGRARASLQVKVESSGRNHPGRMKPEKPLGCRGQSFSKGSCHQLRLFPTRLKVDIFHTSRLKTPGVWAFVPTSYLWESCQLFWLAESICFSFFSGANRRTGRRHTCATESERLDLSSWWDPLLGDHGWDPISSSPSSSQRGRVENHPGMGESG